MQGVLSRRVDAHVTRGTAEIAEVVDAVGDERLLFFLLLVFVALVLPVGDAVLEFVAGDGAADYAEDSWDCQSER
jgi:hypothetical protein